MLGRVALRCSVKKLLLKVSQNSQGNTCVRVTFLRTLKAPVTLLIKRLQHMCFPVNFPKFSGAILLQNISECSLFHDFSENKT